MAKLFNGPGLLANVVLKTVAEITHHLSNLSLGWRMSVSTHCGLALSHNTQTAVRPSVKNTFLP